MTVAELTLLLPMDDEIRSVVSSVLPQLPESLRDAEPHVRTVNFDHTYIVHLETQLEAGLGRDPRWLSVLEKRMHALKDYVNKNIIYISLNDRDHRYHASIYIDKASLKIIHLELS